MTGDPLSQSMRQPANSIQAFDPQKASHLIVITFANEEQAEGLYAELVALDKKNLVDLQDAVFVSKDEEGNFVVSEKIHQEKKKGTRRGAGLGVVAGLLVGGPILGLVGGAVVGRLIGKRMDLGIDSKTIESISQELEQGHTALFILGSSENSALVLATLRKYEGHIIEATVSEEMRASMQRALES